MDWTVFLAQGEKLRWEGRPAPRCFTFRHWRRALFGILLFLLAVFWQLIGIQVAEVYGIRALAWIPIPFLLLGLYLGFGQILRARLEWEKVFYALTDRRLLVHRGIRRLKLDELPVTSLVYFQLQPLGEDIGSVRVWTGEDPPRSLALPCLESPRRLTGLLEEIVSSRRPEEGEIQASEPTPTLSGKQDKV